MADDAFSHAQLEQLRQLLRDELGSVGLRVEGADHIDDARKDFMFLRSLRQGVNGFAAKIGWFFIAAVLGCLVWLVNSGLTWWKAH